MAKDYALSERVDSYRCYLDGKVGELESERAKLKREDDNNCANSGCLSDGSQRQLAVADRELGVLRDAQAKFEELFPA